jgi:UDP-glucuronate 4-epimerase
VYGSSARIPFDETDRTDEPTTLYAATKKSMEVMAYAYAHQWTVPTTIFRFFTVYGPFGRPDMALFKFVEASERREPIDVYGEGRLERDFTYIDDLVEAIVRLVPLPPGDPAAASPFRIVNVGGGRPMEILEFIDIIQDVTGTPLKKNLLPVQKGEMQYTFANPSRLHALSGFTPSTPVKTGVQAFVDWYRAYSRD